MLELNYKESIFDPCLYFLELLDEERAPGQLLGVAGVVLLDVDDFCQGGSGRHQELMGVLRTRLKFGKWKDQLRGVGGARLWVGKEGRPFWSSLCHGYVMEPPRTDSGPHPHGEQDCQGNQGNTDVLPLEPHQSIWMSVADASMANVESKSQGGSIIALVDKVVQTGGAGDFSINSWRLGVRAWPWTTPWQSSSGSGRCRAR